MSENKDVQMMKLHRVTRVYAVDRDAPQVDVEYVISEGEDTSRAKERSQLMRTIPDTWDMDYVTFAASLVVTARVKAKPTLVSQ